MRVALNEPRLCAFHLPRQDRNGRSVLRQAGDAMNVLVMSVLHMYNLACVSLVHPSELLVTVSKGRQHMRSLPVRRRCRSKTPARQACSPVQAHASTSTSPLPKPGQKPGKLASRAAAGVKRKKGEESDGHDEDKHHPAESSSSLQSSLAEARKQMRMKKPASGKS